MLNNDATYFESFGVEHVSMKVRCFIGNENMLKNIFEIQAYDSLFGYFCIEFIDYMLAGKSLIGLS